MLRNIIKLIFLVISILILTVVGCKKQKEESVQQNKPLNPYECIEFSAKDILGSKIPKSAKNPHKCIVFKDANWQGLIVTELSKDDFNVIVAKPELVKNKNLLEQWPEAFNYKHSE